MSEREKKLHELEVFRGFVAASLLPIDTASIEQPEEPSPDIRCVTPDGTRLFELAQVLWEETDPGRKGKA